MKERLNKLLREHNQRKEIMDECFEWVERIVSKKNRDLVSILLPYRAKYLIISVSKLYLATNCIHKVRHKIKPTGNCEISQEQRNLNY